MADLPGLKVNIGADTSDLERGLNRAGRSLKGLATAAAGAGVLVAGALAAMTVQGLKAVDANTKLARSIDSTVNGLRAVQQAAGYAGVSTGEANTAVQQLNRELIRASEVGSPAYEALQKIGLSARELSGLDADERMALIADRMKGMGISAAQASDILRDLGVRSRNMALLLLQGGDAIRSAREEVTKFGVELTTVQTDSIEAANDAIDRMSLVFEGLRNRLAAEVAPALQGVADKFNALAQSAAVQDAIERLAKAFGALADVILSEDFIGVAVSGLEMMAGVSATVAEGMVLFANNIEAVTLAFSGLAIAVALAGGPLTIVVGALAIALGGIAMWRGAAEDAAEGSKTAAKAQAALNEALGVFYQTGAPSAGNAAVDLANDNYKLAQSAMAAAAAELAKAEAMAMNIESGQDPASRMSGPLTRQQMERDASKAVTAAQADLDAAKKLLEETQRMMDSAARTVTGSDFSSVTIPGSTIPEIKPLDLTMPDGAGGGGGGVDTPDAVGALAKSLLTQTEALELWREESLAALGDFNALELEALGGQANAKLRIEEEYNERLSALRQSERQAAFSSIMGAGQQILSAIGQTNEKAAKAAQTLGAFEALVNAYRAASQALGDPKLPWFAKVSAAASLLATGIGFANSIKSMSKSSPSASSGGGGGASTAAAAAPAPANYYIDLQGDTFSRASVQSTLSAALQGEIDRGARVVFGGA